VDPNPHQTEIRTRIKVMRVHNTALKKELFPQNFGLDFDANLILKPYDTSLYQNILNNFSL
jgi:hypothetical protein